MRHPRKSAPERVRVELLRMGLETEGIGPGELEAACKRIAAIAKKHRLSPEVAAREFGYIRATDDAIRTDKAGEQPAGGNAG